MKFNERILLIIEKEKLTVPILSKKLGYPRTQTVYNVINGKVFPSFDFLFRLFSSKMFDKYDPVWLITGKGNMLKKEEYLISDEKTVEKVQEATTNYESKTDKMEKRVEQLLDIIIEQREEISQLKKELEKHRGQDEKREKNAC
jgi:peptidoglycan hydrolase CwlO-like protein